MPILTPEERVGTDIADKYRIERILGKGGMGVVFQGRHLWTEREIALKILYHNYAQDEGIARRFLQEARTAAQIKHPSVVDVLDMGRDQDGTVYLVLEMLEGESLADRLDRKGITEPEEALELLLPVMDALSMAHDEGIVHRDLKPDNIFISRTAKGRRVPKLLDFGIAKVVEGEGKMTTRTGAVIGTPQYMAPEQVRALPDVGPAADVWSMGVVLFEAMTARLPFESDTPTAVLAEILTTRPPSVGEMNPDVPAPIAMTIDRALMEDRAIRFSTMRSFMAALLEAADECGMAIDRPTLMPQFEEHSQPRITRAHSATVAARKKGTTPGPGTRALPTPTPRSSLDPLGSDGGLASTGDFDGETEVTDAWSEGVAKTMPPTSSGPSKRLVQGVLSAGLLLAALGAAALAFRPEPVPEVEHEPPALAEPPATPAPVEPEGIVAEPAVPEVEVIAAPEVEVPEPEIIAVPEASAVERAAREAARRRRHERREAREAAASMETMETMETTTRGANETLIIR